MSGLGRIIKNLLAGALVGVVAGGSALTVSFAEEGGVDEGVVEDSFVDEDFVQDLAYWELPGFSCEDIYVPAGATLSYESVSATSTECAFDTPRGVVLYYWLSTAFRDGSGEGWGLFVEDDILPTLFGIEAVEENFGTYWEQDPEARDSYPIAGSRIDTGSPRWGVLRRDGAEFGGSPEAITRMLEVTAERVAVLAEELARIEDPEANREFWDQGALDCLEVWDGAGLEPGYELVTINRFQDFLNCAVIEEGQNPFARDTVQFLRFGFTEFDCQADPQSLNFFRGNYDFESEESFGVFEFRQESFFVRVTQERTELYGQFIDEAACVVYEGWPEAIERLVTIRSPETILTPGENPEPAVAAERVLLSPPETLSQASLIGAIGAIVLVVSLLALRRPQSRLVPTDRSDAPGARDKGAATAHLGAHVGIVLGLSVVVTLGLMASDQTLRSVFGQGQVNVASFAEFFAVWGPNLLGVTVLAIILRVVLGGGRSRISPAFAVWSLLGVAAAIIAIVFSPGLTPVVPLLALLLAGAAVGSSATGHRRHTLVVWVATLLSLVLLTVASIEAVMAGTEWVQQSLLIAAGCAAAGAVALAVPVTGGPGHGAYSSHPVMWAAAMAVSWWAFVTVAGLSWLVSAVLVVVAVAAAVISGVLTSGGKNPTTADKAYGSVAETGAKPTP